MRLLLALLLAAPAAAHQGDKSHKHELTEPSIWMNLRLGMPEQMETALENWDPKFAILALTQLDDAVRMDYPFTTRQTPSTVIGDFNADKVKDIALLGWSRGALRLIAIVSAPGSYKIVEIRQWAMKYPKEPEVKQVILYAAGAAGKPEGIRLRDGKDVVLRLKSGAFAGQ